jgi:hypothetical protein
MTDMNIIRTALALCMLGTVACAGSSADKANPAFSTTAPNPAQAQPVSVTLERLDGQEFPAFFHLGNVYVAGDIGARYQIRLTNHTNERVEAVVAVDGRDVITGDVGNYKRQRGYVIEPYSSVVVTGFRQSLDRVAAFRFTDLQGSYTAQWGTPQNAGVVGVAVFREKERRRKKSKALTTAPPPRDFAEDELAQREPFPDSRQRKSSAPPSAEPEMEAGMADDAAAEAPAAPGDRGAGGDFAPAPPRANELGTEYGESVTSSVREIDFKRKKKRKPDTFVTLYYDSFRGLEARGVPVNGGPAPIAAEPDPFPGR